MIVSWLHRGPGLRSRGNAASYGQARRSVEKAATPGAVARKMSVVVSAFSGVRDASRHIGPRTDLHRGQFLRRRTSHGPANLSADLSAEASAEVEALAEAEAGHYVLPLMQMHTRRACLMSVVALVTLAGVARAQLRPVRAEITPLVESNGVHASSTVRTALQVRLPKGFHVQ